MQDFSKFIMSREQVWAALEGRAALVSVYFEGGNDEGGVDDISFKDSEGKTIKRMQEYYPTGTWNSETRTMDYDTSKVTLDELLSFNLCKPVYDKYYSFAGDFYVTGTVTWDVIKKTVTMQGNEEVKEYENFEEVI